MDRPTLLIGGGYDKGSSYSEWIQAFDGKVKYLVLIGQTREKIAAEAKALGFTDIVFADSLAEAVQFCADHAEKGRCSAAFAGVCELGHVPELRGAGKDVQGTGKQSVTGVSVCEKKPEKQTGCCF